MSRDLIIGTVLFLLRDDLLALVQRSCTFVADRLRFSIEINVKTSFKTHSAMLALLQREILPARVAIDDRREVSLGNGNYKLCRKQYTIYVMKTDDAITLSVYYIGFREVFRMFFSPVAAGELYAGWYEEAKTFLTSFVTDTLDSLVNGQTTESPVYFYFPTSDMLWGNTIPRRKRLSAKGLTSDMNAFLNDVEEFRSPATAKTYELLNRPYRKGYCISGKPGTGKSAVVEIVASRCSSSVYVVNLNTKDMTDASLSTLIARVPPCSVIVFDEFEKQYDGAMKNSTITLTDGGILGALDGVYRLSFGTIVVIIANDVSKLPPTFQSAMFRSGRIDKHFVFKQTFL